MKNLDFLSKNPKEFVEFFGIDSEKLSDETLRNIADFEFYLRHCLIIAKIEETGDFSYINLEKKHVKK